MVVKVYISGISGNKEVKKRQQRVLMILDSKNIKYEIIDITEPGREGDKDFMQNNSKSNGGTVSDPNPRSPLPPQVFNDEEYCGDYDQFDLANEIDTLEQFLKVEVPAEEPPTDGPTNAVNGDVQANKEGRASKENSHDRDATVDSTNTDNPAENANGTADPDTQDENLKKEGSVEKETSPARQKSIEMNETLPESIEKSTEELGAETEQISNENVLSKSEDVNENGAASSREQSEEKQQLNDQIKENPSEALIQSEQVASTE